GIRTYDAKGASSPFCHRSRNRKMRGSSANYRANHLRFSKMMVLFFWGTLKSSHFLSSGFLGPLNFRKKRRCRHTILPKVWCPLTKTHVWEQGRSFRTSPKHGRGTT